MNGWGQLSWNDWGGMTYAAWGTFVFNASTTFLVVSAGVFVPTVITEAFASTAHTGVFVAGVKRTGTFDPVEANGAFAKTTKDTGLQGL